MTAFQKSIFTLSVIALSSFDSSRHPFLGVEGAIATEFGVTCHPDSPTTCYGQKTFWTPSPAVVCPDPPSNETCAPVYLGGWGWEYEFVRGLEDGSMDPNAIEEAKYLTVTVTVEDDETTCKVKINEQDCSSCSAEGCEFGSIKYGCTYIENAASSTDECVAVDEFFYPYPLHDDLGDSNFVADENDAEAEEGSEDGQGGLSSKSQNVVGHYFGARILLAIGSATVLFSL